MNRIASLWASEPVLISGLVSAVIAVLVAFNVPVTDDQRVSVVALVGVLGTIVGALVGRSQATSPATLRKRGR